MTLTILTLQVLKAYITFGDPRSKLSKSCQGSHDRLGIRVHTAIANFLSQFYLILHQIDTRGYE